MHRTWVQFLILFWIGCGSILFANPKTKQKIKPKTIIISVDGFPYYYWSKQEHRQHFPHLTRIFEKYGVFPLETVNPSVTYPAHTSMVTGKDPIEHGIYNNTLSDPFDRNDGGWMWYAEDIQVPTLWTLAKDRGKKTANVFWPVTVGASIDWNLPQYWRKKIPEDDKLLRALSTKGLHKEAESKVGTPLNDVTKDEIKLKTASYLYKTYQPDLLFVYTTDLDSMHHAYGPSSEQALKRLTEIDKALQEFFVSLGVFSKGGPNLILVSDHGFFSAEEVCAPNVILKQRGYIQDESSTYKLTFKSSGGIAILLPGEGTSISEEEVESIAKEIVSVCTGATWLSFRNGEKPENLSEMEMQRLKRLNTLHPKAIGILQTKQALFFSGSRKGEVYSKSSKKIHGHGYWNDMEEMKTIGFVYSANGNKYKMSSVKDIFTIVKDMMQLDRNSIQKQKPKSKK
ncbi:type I phosphodiesterase/nucleotide pyrophosphatase [Leptospira ryugenii]|uniref:Type I phosphodiesterase/nucleotide pyrophosphatase n=1 Tax=Leptospira ryugenii TaxID=1917863 RepID=A0A2P2DWM0_9LEPT|nr:ectonucleotide pyrophosphatase/phosphodiesterase [Leptospira ryugenii]GBF49007.1 type I phosphodiesterase/nucleotide pyrophosphatase [Leptospira ryugenii]